MPVRERYSDEFTGKADDNIRSVLFAESTDNDRLRRIKRVLLRVINNELTAKQRKAIMLYYYDGMKIVQIADQLGISFQAVSALISRGRSKLFRILQYYM